MADWAIWSGREGQTTEDHFQRSCGVRSTYIPNHISTKQLNRQFRRQGDYKFDLTGFGHLGVMAQSGGRGGVGDGAAGAPLGENE